MKTVTPRRNRDLYNQCDVIIKSYSDWSETPCSMNNKLNNLTPIWNKVGEDTTSVEGSTLYILKTTMPTTIKTINFKSNTDLYSVEYIKGKPTTLAEAFYGCINAEELHLNALDVSECTDLTSAFSNASYAAAMKLRLIEWDTWDLSKCNSLNNTFDNCRSLPNETFKLLKTIKKIKGYGFLSNTFIYCYGLTDLNFALDWDLSEYTTGFNSTFQYCKNLTDTSALANWNISKITSLRYTFYGCTSLEDFSPLKNWNVSNVTDMLGTFRETAIKNVDFMHDWDLTKVTDISGMFSSCALLENINSIDFSKLSNVTNTARFLQECKKIRDITPMKYFDSSKCTTFRYTFAGCTSLECDVNTICKDLVKSACTDLFAMFNNCTSLTCDMEFKGWDTSNVVNMYDTFGYCSKVKRFKLNHFNTSKVTTLAACFRYCTNAEVISIEDWDVSSVVSMGSTFDLCQSVKALKLGKWRTPSLTDLGRTFSYTCKLEEFDISGFDTHNVTTMASTFYNCLYNKDVDLCHFDVSNVTNFSGTFMDCYFTNVNVSTWDTRKATTMDRMFCDIIKMKKLDISNFRWDIACNCQMMFYYYDYCAALQLPLLEIDLTNVDTANWTNNSFTNYYIWRYIPQVQVLKLSQCWFNNSLAGNFAGWDDSCMRDWTRESMMESLYTNLIGRDTTNVINIRLKRDAYNRLSEEDRSLICSNGFTITCGR